MAKKEIEQALIELGLTVKAEFVPFSKSRNAKEKDLSLNWRVTLANGRDILTTDYSAGCGHCPGYKQGLQTVVRDNLIRWECEHGFKAQWFDGFNGARKASGAQPIEPNACGVVASLVMDSDVLDYSTFESWASAFGYDVDSRKAETVYRACLEIALKLRNGLGEAGLAKLREACQDY